jgi:catechol 2,3-dioxygenase-like lactoylglutathione lyase family enzyme
MRLNHVALVCSSEQRADDFYEGVLGLRKIKSSVLGKDLAEQIFEIPRECRIILYGNDNFAVEVFVAKPAPGSVSPFVHLCLEVKNREGFLGKCQAMGLTVKRVPKGDFLLTFVQDYDGNLFEIKELAA